MKDMNSQQMFDAVHRALEEVDRRLASGELDGSGRYWTDEELAAGKAKDGKLDPVRVKGRIGTEAAGAATGRVKKPKDATEAPAA